MPTLILDTEVFGDYFLAAFMDADTGAVQHFEMYPPSFTDDGDTIPGAALDTDALAEVVRGNRLVTFNGANFDMPIVSEAVAGASCATLKRIADAIIKNNKKWWTLGITPVECDHVDLIEVAPGVASLKAYGARLHTRRLQDLPIDPDASIAPEQRELLRSYCDNDLAITLALYRQLEPQIGLREQMGQVYGMDLRSKSDAQIAEAVLRQEVERILGRRLVKPETQPGDRFSFAVPAWVSFATDPLREVLDTVAGAAFTIAPNGAVTMPDDIAGLRITIGGSTYRMGIGGLHSSEKTVAHRADADHLLVDRDVTSYYPSIILRCGLAPEHMGAAFTTVYRRLVERRVAAKRAGETVTADALKIAVNGSFGKLGSPYSILYSPKLLIQTTLTGQLALLMLIEALEAAGIPVVSANTDGIVIRCPRAQAWEMEAIVWRWEQATGFGTEETEYAALYSRDVNNYIAVKPSGSVKLKGAYAPAGIAKHPANEIAVAAAVLYLVRGTPVEQTVRECRDVRKFVTVRQVKGGAVKGDTYLGRVVRWYYARGATGTITYQVNGYTVPRSEGARPLMELPDALPADLDHDWYIAEARSILAEVGAAAPAQQEMFA